MKIGSHDKFSSDSHKIKRLITEACNEWAKYADLKFSEVKDARIADIVISFENPYHIEIDHALMDESVLAHAFYPSIAGRLAGDIHMNNRIKWDFDGIVPKRGFMSFYRVFLHELGHALGIKHSNDKNSVMTDAYHLNSIHLTDDDIHAVQSLYGIKGSSSSSSSVIVKFTPSKYFPTRSPPRRRVYRIIESTTQLSTTDEPATAPTSTSSSSQLPMLAANRCALRKFDAVLMIRNELIMIKDDFVWRPSRDYEPRTIHSMWRDLPTSLQKVDAVLETDFGETWIFSFGFIYRCYQKNFVGVIALDAIGIPHEIERIEAAFTFHDENFLIGGDFIFTLQRSKRVKNDFKPIEFFIKNVKNFTFDTILNDGLNLYFFKDEYFYKFNRRTMSLNLDSKKSVVEYFLDCDTQNDKNVGNFATNFKINFLTVALSIFTLIFVR